MKMIKRVSIAIAVLVLLALGSLYFSPKQFTQGILASQYVIAGLAEKSVQLPDGLTIHYLEGGKAQGEAPTLVLLHGFAANREHFVRVAMKLKSQFHIIIPDQIGFGESSRIENGDYHYDTQAERLNVFLTQLGVAGPIQLGGSSMGGAIAIAYTVLHPNQVKSLWLLDSGGVYSAPQSDVLKRYRTTGKHELIIHDVDGFARNYNLAMSHPPFVPKPVLNVLAQENITNAPLLEHIIAQILSDSIENRAAQVTVPTLIVYGAEDKLTNAAAGPVLAKLITGSQLIIMPDTGHLPMLERPGQTAKDYVAFVRSAGVIQ